MPFVLIFFGVLGGALTFGLARVSFGLTRRSHRNFAPCPIRECNRYPTPPRQAHNDGISICRHT
jgi:hypothetical protein